MSKSKAKGTWGESKIRDYLAGWFPAVLRPAMHGSKDEGDLVGIPLTTVEAKNCGRYEIQKWIRELDVEKANAGMPYGVLIVKPVGVGDTRMGDWWAIQRLEDWANEHQALVGALEQAA